METSELLQSGDSSNDDIAKIACSSTYHFKVRVGNFIEINNFSSKI
ncbi:hypothetical protein JCM10914A_45820 [Paenibacillus sp. JCM 10914]